MPTPRPLHRLARRAVARVKPAVPDRVWPVLLAARSLTGDGPVVGPPWAERVLVLAAHPDDESMGCAGTVALLAATGARVTAVFATDGEATRGSGAAPGETARLRRAEAVEACAALGVRDVRHLGLPDGGLPDRLDHLAAGLRDAVASTDPDLVLLPWFLDGHPDHQALDDALPAAGLRDGTRVWGYETWTPLPATRLVDVTPVLAQRTAALGAHRTAHLAFDVSGVALGLSRWRSVHGLLGRGHAEAFLAADVATYLDLMARTRAAAAAVRPPLAGTADAAGAT